jgi:hypothetical protein
VVGAREVVELVAEVSVAVVEVDVEEQLGESDGNNHQHAFDQERRRAASWGRKRRRDGGHEGVKNSRSEEKLCHGNHQEEIEREVSRSDSKKWPFAAGKNCHLTWGSELFHRAWLRLRAQNDADTKVTSLVDYLFFAPIGL